MERVVYIPQNMIQEWAKFRKSIKIIGTNDRRRFLLGRVSGKCAG